MFTLLTVMTPSIASVCSDKLCSSTTSVIGRSPSLHVRLTGDFFWLRPHEIPLKPNININSETPCNTDRNQSVLFNEQVINACRSHCSSVNVCVRERGIVCVLRVGALTQVRRQPGRLVLHSGGWPRSRSMDGGGSGVWQRVRGRTERAPLLLWIDTETQSMAHEDPHHTGHEPKHPHAASPHFTSPLLLQAPSSTCLHCSQYRSDKLSNSTNTSLPRATSALTFFAMQIS